MSTTPIPSWMQDEVLERDGWICLACKRPVHRWRNKTRSDSASIDHIYPDTHVHRGMTEVDNLQTLCRDCNSAKGSNYIDYRPKPPEPELIGATYAEQLGRLAGDFHALLEERSFELDLVEYVEDLDPELAAELAAAPDLVAHVIRRSLAGHPATVEPRLKEEGDGYSIYLTAKRCTPFLAFHSDDIDEIELYATRLASVVERGTFGFNQLPDGTYVVDLEKGVVHPTYTVGEVVNGHQWTGTEWARVYEVGEVANGHQWNGTSWVPVPEPKSSKLLLGYPQSQWRNALIFVVVFYIILIALSQN